MISINNYRKDKPPQFSWGGAMNTTNKKNKNLNYTQQKNSPNIRWMLIGYDLIVYTIVAVILLVIYTAAVHTWNE